MIIITGGAKGLGLGITRALVGAGKEVCVTGRDEAALKEAERSLGVVAFRADVAKPGDWDALFAFIQGKGKSIEALVNNAGWGGAITPLEEMDPAGIAETVAVNLTGVIQGCQKVIPHLKAAGGGTIINISSVCDQYGWPGWTVYSACKAGLAMFGKTLYAELREQGISVTTITPSWSATGFADAAGIDGHPVQDPEVRKQCMQPEDMGEVILHVLKTPAHLNLMQYTILPKVQAIEPM